MKCRFKNKREPEAIEKLVKSVKIMTTPNA